jgi:hypothetical protein
MVSSASKEGRSDMNHGALFPKAAKRVAMVAALFALLGTVGCMTPPQAVMNPAGDVARTTAPPDPAENRCAQFSCEQ